HNAGFDLQYDFADNRWAFTEVASDTPNAAVTRAKSTAAPTVGAWTHLVGVFDASNGAMTLYVNGAASGTATDTTPFAATGPLVIGRIKYSDNIASYFKGSIANVQAYPRALTAAEVGTLYTGGRSGGQAAVGHVTAVHPAGRHADHGGGYQDLQPARSGRHGDRPAGPPDHLHLRPTRQPGHHHRAQRRRHPRHLRHTRRPAVRDR